MPEVIHAWKEPVKGAMTDWLRTLPSKILLLIIFASAFSALAVWRHAGGSAAAIRYFERAAALLTIPLVLYAIINRQIRLCDDKIQIIHGRSGSSYSLNKIAGVAFDLVAQHQSIVVTLKTGKPLRLFLDQKQLSADTIREFFSVRGVHCSEFSSVAS